MSLETRAIIELVNQGHLPPLCVNQKTKLKDITMKVAEKHSNAEYAGVTKEFTEKVKDIALPLLPNDTARDGFVLHLILKIS